MREIRWIRGLIYRVIMGEMGGEGLEEGMI